MKILHILWGFPLGGTETMVVDIANLQVRKHEVRLMIMNDKCSELLRCKLNKEIGFIEIKRTPGTRSISTLLRSYQEVLAYNPDVIHIHSSNLVKLIPPTHRNIVATIHATGLQVLKTKRIKSTIAISRAVADDLSERYSMMEAKVIENGVPCSSLLTRENGGSHPFKVIQVSRLMHELKGQDILLRAVKLAQERVDTPIHLHFVGDGPSRRYLEDLSSSLGLRHVEFLGEKDRSYIFESLRNYNLLVQPSRFEGFGLTIVEAMAAKVPVLVSNIQGPFEIIEGGSYGFWFENLSVEDCARKIVSIFLMHQEHEGLALRNITENAYRHALDNYDIENTVLRYEDEYRL